MQVGESKVKLEFALFPIQLEEVIDLQIKHDLKMNMLRGWLEGTNMYMGKTPLFIRETVISDNEVLHNGELFIGSCSEPNMRWRLVIEFEDLESQKPQQIAVFFQTQS